MRAIVDHRRGALACAALREVDADPIAAAHDVSGVDPLRPQRPYRRVADRMSRQARNVDAPESEMCQADRYVRLAAAESRTEQR